MKKIISLIVAVSENNVIGKNNELIWHMPADLRYFKEKTSGKPVIMGRKTFDSIIKARGTPLPNRQNIVITRNSAFHHDMADHASNLSEAIKLVTDEPSEVMIIGGGDIYQQALPMADKIYLTRIHHTFDGDVFFPEVDLQHWHLTDEEHHQKDEKNSYDYSFLVYERL